MERSLFVFHIYLITFSLEKVAIFRVLLLSPNPSHDGTQTTMPVKFGCRLRKVEKHLHRRLLKFVFAKILTFPTLDVESFCF